MIKQIVFDVNGVLQGVRKYKFLFFHNGLSYSDNKEYFYKAVDSVAHKEANSGIFKTKEDTLEEMKKEYPGEEVKLERVYLANWESCFVLYPKMIKLVKQLSVDYDLYILSNMSFAGKQYFTSNNIFPLFKGSVFSCDVAVQKPNPKIFQILITEYNLKPQETLFIDNATNNINAAKKLGFKTVKSLPFGKSIKKIKQALN